MRDNHHHHHHHHHWREKDSYAYNAGAPGPGPNVHRLYRDKKNGVIAGVCAGVARYYGWNRDVLRASLVLLTLFSFPFPVIIYAAMAFLIKSDDQATPMSKPSADEEEFWRTFTQSPRATFSELKHRFRALDQRLSDMESAVVSDEYGLRKAFQDLERK